jgi:hypothetical protein
MVQTLEVKLNKVQRCQGYKGCTGLEPDGGHCASCLNHNSEVTHPRRNVFMDAVHSVGAFSSDPSKDPRYWNSYSLKDQRAIAKKLGRKCPYDTEPILTGMTPEEAECIIKEQESKCVPGGAVKEYTVRKRPRKMSKTARIAHKVIWGADPITKETEFSLLEVHHIVEHAMTQDDSRENLIPIRIDIHRQFRNGRHRAKFVEIDGIVYFQPTNPRYQHLYNVVINPPTGHDREKFLNYVRTSNLVLTSSK